MNAFKTSVIPVLLLFGFLYSGCKTIQPTIENADRKPMPETFGSTIDSTNSASRPWNLFFEDKNLCVLIDTAIRNNYDVLMTLQKIEMARNDLRLSEGAMLPTVASNFAYLQRKFGYYTMDDAGNRTTEITPGKIIPTNLPDYFAGLQTNWEIDVWGKLRSKKKSAFLRYISSVEGKNLVVTNLVSEVANTYYELISLKNELDIIRQTLQLQQKALDIIKVQKQAGVANEFAVKQFEAEVLHFQSLEFETLQNITENENKLNFLSGRFPQPIITEKINFADKIQNPIKEGIPSQLLRNRPDVRQTEFELLASKYDVNAARKAFYPSFNITGSLGFQAFNPSFLFSAPQSVAYSLLGGITTPLLNRTAIKAHFNNAKASQLDAMYNYQKAILTGYIEVSNQLSVMKNLEQIHDLKSKEVAILSQSIDISGDLFKTGRTSYFEVLLAQNRSFETQLELSSVRKRQLQAIVNAYKALGGGWQ